jgi:hypothetical protein
MLSPRIIVMLSMPAASAAGTWWALEPEPPASSPSLVAPGSVRARGTEALAEQNARRLARQEQLYAQLEEAASQEARDPVWAERTESLIRAAVHTAGPGSQLAGAECRSSLCRIELAHSGTEAPARAVRGLLSTSGLQGESVVRQIQQGDRFFSLVYVAREGTRLPPFRP